MNTRNHKNSGDWYKAGRIVLAICSCALILLTVGIATLLETEISGRNGCGHSRMNFERAERFHHTHNALS